MKFVPFALAGISFILGVLSQANGLTAPQVLVLYNKSVPDSEQLALEYQKLRNIPKENLLGLEMPITEEISREEYEKLIRNPIRVNAEKLGWWKIGQKADERKIQAIVGIRGVPLKIRQQPVEKDKPAPSPMVTDAASLDGELAVLAREVEPKTKSFLTSSYYRKDENIEKSRADVLLVTRIDAPSVETCRRMMKDASEVEKKGLWGWSLVDIAQFYPMGDNWLKNIVKKNDQEGIPTYCDVNKPVMPKEMALPGKVATYYGWYEWNVAGVFQQKGFRFQPGAVAVHIHSFSANTMRNPGANWCGPLLELGATATLGNVYEPYLQMTHELDVFHDRLLKGYTLAEAAGMALRTVSWQATVFGDPLYRPFAKFNLTGMGKPKEDPNFASKMLRIASQRWNLDPEIRQQKLAQAAAQWKLPELWRALAYYAGRQGNAQREKDCLKKANQ